MISSKSSISSSNISRVRGRVKTRPHNSMKAMLLDVEIIHELLQNSSAGGMTQFLEGFILDLADAFTGHLEDVSHFLEGAVITIVYPKAEPDHPFLSGGEGL